MPSFSARWLPASKSWRDVALAAIDRAIRKRWRRMVVTPGREQDGILNMPGGQSGHPLSPFFLAGHADWMHGRPMPFLPGPPEHAFSLTPR